MDLSGAKTRSAPEVKSTSNRLRRCWPSETNGGRQPDMARPLSRARVR